MMPPEHSASSLVEQVQDDAVCPVLAEHAAAIKTLGKRVVGDVIEIGRRLSECRALLKEEGGWRAWLKAEFVWDRKTASNFIHLFELSKSEGERVLPSNLPLRSLYLLAAPSTPESARDAVLALAANGEQLTHAQVAQVIAEAKPVKAARKAQSRAKLASQVSEEVLQQRAAAAERIHALISAKTRDDIGPTRNSESARETACIEDLRAEKHRFECENIALRSELEEAKAAKLPHAWFAASLSEREHFLDDIGCAEILAVIPKAWDLERRMLRAVSNGKFLFELKRRLPQDRAAVKVIFFAFISAGPRPELDLEAIPIAPDSEATQQANLS